MPTTSNNLLIPVYIVWATTVLENACGRNVGLLGSASIAVKTPPSQTQKDARGAWKKKSKSLSVLVGFVGIGGCCTANESVRGSSTCTVVCAPAAGSQTFSSSRWTTKTMMELRIGRDSARSGNGG